MVKIRVGNGLDPQTTMGPLVSQGQMETVAGYVRKGLEDRATLVVGGRPLVEDPCAEGYFYAPTLFDYVSPNSALALEETSTSLATHSRAQPRRGVRSRQ
jgi:acyl-CoA reductase-like NAD-dependent aldehyde dehydrogenase